MKELLRIRDLSTDKKNMAALNRFRLQIFSSEIVGIIGLNGSGKNTLAPVLTGEESIEDGSIYYKGRIIEIEGQRISRMQLEKLGIFVIRTGNKLIRNLNISENMSISLKHSIIDLLKNPGHKEKLVELTLKEFFPYLNPGTNAFDLPLSVQWMIGILKAYIEGAELIFLDRILEFCSEKERNDIFSFIKILRKKGCSFVITYNKIAAFLSFFDRLGVIRNGELAGIVSKTEYDPKLLADLVVGRKFTEKFTVTKKGEAAEGRRLLEVSGQVELELQPAEILGLYDPFQERSAELIDLLSGYSLNEDNKIKVNGSSVELNEDYHAIQSGIGIVSEKIFDKLFFKELTAGQNLSLSAAKRTAGRSGYIPSTAEKYLEEKYPVEIGIPDDFIRLPVRLINKDYQFILALHMRILSGAKIIILENPVRRADLLTRELIYMCIEAVRKKGAGIIFVSTDISELDGFCDRIVQHDRIGSI